MASNDSIEGGAGNDEIVEDAPVVVAEPAAVEAAPVSEVPRDERRDSIDPQSGQLTAEAVAIRLAEREAAGE